MTQLQPRERTIIESALRDSEERQELLFHRAPSPMWVFDVDTLHFLAVNDAALTQYGYTRAEFLALTLRDLRTQDSRAAYWRAHKALIAGHELHGIYRHRRHDGSVIDVELRTSTLPIGGGRLRIASATDITDQKRGVDATRFLDRASGILMASLEHDFLCRNLATLAVPALGDWCVVHRHAGAGGLAPCGLAHALPTGQATLATLVDERPCPDPTTALYRAWRASEVIQLEGEDAVAAVAGHGHGDIVDRARLLDVGAVLYVPILGRGGSLGVLECVSGAGRTIDRATRALAIALAERASLAMVNALRFRDAREAAITPPAPVPDAAEQSAAWFSENIPDGYVALDTAFTMTYVNGEAERMFGRPREELVGRNLWAIFPEAVGGPFDMAYSRAMAEKRTVTIEEYFPTLDAWFEVCARPSAAGLGIFFRDVTRLRRALQRHEEDEAQYRDFVESATDLIHMLAPDGRVLYGNRAWRETLGYTLDEVRQLHISQVVAPESRELALRLHQESLARPVPTDVELVVLRKDGTRAVVRGRSNWRFVDGAPVSSRAIYRDVTAEVQARELLAQAQRTEAAMSRAKSAFLDRMSHEMRTPLTAVLGFAGILERNRGGTLTPREVDFARRIGVQGRGLLTLIEDVLAYADIESRRVDVRIARVELAALLAEVTDLYQGDASRAAVTLTLEVPSEPVTVETDASVLRRIMRYLLSDAIPRAEGGQVIVRLQAGETPGILVRSESRDADVHAAEPMDADQLPELSLTIAESLSQVLGYGLSLRQVARGVAESTITLGGDPQRLSPAEENSAKTLHAILEASPLPIIAFQPDWTVRLWNSAAQTLYGWASHEAIERRLPMLRPEDDAAFREILRRALDAPRGIADVPAVHRRRDGTVMDVHLSVAPLRAPDGRLRGFLAIVADVSERTRLEEELRQAQRMEVVGRLAGGIAHDFNNLLTVISAHAQFLAMDLPPGSAQAEDAQGILETAERAAALTRQLLMFARKQPAHRRTVNLNVTLAHVDRILRRTLGSHIEFITLPAPRGVCVDADPGQVEQVMMNLILNARDAMPTGGALVVEIGTTEGTGPDSGRRWAAITVSDTGVGMDATTKARIFEPFFTTKGPERGTGLGLATVYSIVTDAGGGIDVDSTLGAGTTMRVRLPLGQLPAGDTEAAEEHGSPRGTETVLLVEDQDAVRMVAARALRAYGYTVLLARHGRDALALLEQHPQADLLLTDLVMPEMTGSELATRVRERRPDMRILFMSGYSEPPSGIAGLHDDVPLVRKPFAGDALARAVRDALDA